jgi:hypothetical protein
MKKLLSTDVNGTNTVTTNNNNEASTANVNNMNDNNNDDNNNNNDDDEKRFENKERKTPVCCRYKSRFQLDLRKQPTTSQQPRLL